MDAPAPLTRDAALALAAGIPTAADGEGLARAYCARDEAGFRVVFGLRGGTRHSAPAGPPFAAPRDACLLAAVLNERTEPDDLVAPGAP